MTPDLSTNYLGFRLTNPIVASASPLTGQPDVLARMEQAGVAAAVLPSLFEEQVVRAMGLADKPGGASYFAAMEGYNRGTDCYLRLIERAKRAVSFPVIASLNGASAGGWGRYPHMVEQAGADALELDLYLVPTDLDEDSAVIEQRCLDIVEAVRGQVTIPLAVKLSPYFTSLPHVARRLVSLGVDGLVLFNRSLEPDIDPHGWAVHPRLTLSSRDELRLPLRWLGLLHGRVGCSLAATSGVHEAEDVLKALMAGADVAMVASVLMRRGVDSVTTMLRQLGDWLAAHECASVRQLVGSVSRRNCDDPSAYERSNYLRALVSYLDEGASPLDPHPGDVPPRRGAAHPS
ncbi:dihydroorotate dehydrogenase-like protein [Botrimarina sp.]|uniref:dihydroorotate dehydrogenase-like protein n=1 Tax=Botrimarina sp. TaxID=2795802 RepID=UPI0032EF9EE2